ncbi:MAG: SCO1664 family protein [Chloroflexi bacterium]|nr:SCO1664 family protein [Chloroflexota bacterium]
MDEEFLHHAFAAGSIELKGQFTLGSNYTFLVTVTHDGQEIQAVYKPQKGEQPLWDFPENTLAGREVAAYHISQALGWGLVPYTIFREDGPFGPGSLQQFIEYNPNYHYFTFKPEDKDKLRPVALFDHLTNNADRKGSHIFFEKATRHLYAIDHGLCFNVDDKLRTVIWDFAGEPIAPEYLTAIQQLTTLPAALEAELARYLNVDELAALVQRAGLLLAVETYPLQPVDRRFFPYPPL